MSPIYASLFVSTSPASQQLRNRLEEMCLQHEIAGLKISLRTYVDGTQRDMTIAGLRDDLVIFDASVEDIAGSNYKALQMYPATMNHFLVVSRTRIPVNFTPFVIGGTPETYAQSFDGADTLSNDVLIAWIEMQVLRLKPKLPRADNARLPAGQEDVPDLKTLRNLGNILMNDSIEDKNRNLPRYAFVSYLSRYSRKSIIPEDVFGKNVEDLMSYINLNSTGEVIPFYYPPGVLSSEFMTEHRRWQVLAAIDSQIRLSRQFWIFETDDYYNSWWTIAELAMLAYIKHNNEFYGISAELPDIFLCRSFKDGFLCQNVGHEYIQDLSDVIGRSFGRYLSNSDPQTMGYETIKVMQSIRRRSLPMQWMNYKVASVMSSVLFGIKDIQKKFEGNKGNVKMNFDLYREMLNSPVYDDSFWKSLIVQCKKCSSKNTHKQDFDFRAFINQSLPGQMRIDERDIDKILASKRWQCPNCGALYIVEQNRLPQLRWWPVRVGVATGPNGTFVEQIPTYNIRN